MAHKILEEAQEMNDLLIKWRRDLHQIPETDLELPKTVEYISKRLDEMNVEYKVFPEVSVIIAQIGKGDKCFLLRSDMDALPVEEETGLEFASKNGCMHGCGHDLHATILLGAAKILKAHGNITQTQISMVHTVFNIVTTVLLFPVSDWIIKLAKKIGHVEEEVQDESVVLLDDRMLETPGIAIQSTVSELVRMGHVVADSLEVARKVMFERKEEQIAFLKEEESKVDRLSAGITSYAIKLSTLQINEREHEEVAHMLQIVSDMERISDYCENISEFAESLLEKQVDFSEVGVEHLNKMLDVCIASYLYALEAFESNDRESALKTIEKETEADGLEISLRAKHIKRLTNQQCNTEAGVVFLDSLVCLERISDHARNIAEEVLAE